MSSSSNQVEEIRTITTPHYTFDLKIIEKKTPIHKCILLVGNSRYPCLEANILMPHLNERFRAFGLTDTVRINQIDALIECSREEITEDYMELYSFGKELLDFLIEYIQSSYPHVKHLSLNDMSYIPCNRLSGDTLDLLTYSIAKYGKTWYEMKFNAYQKNPTRYSDDIIRYKKSETKSKISFENILEYIISRNNFAESIIFKDIDKYTNMYNSSPTLPQFFQILSKHIPRNDRCRFFKGWLEDFIKDRIHVNREWFIDLNIHGGKRRKTRRRTR